MKVAGPGSYLYCRYCSSLYFPQDSKDEVDVLGVESEYHCALCRGTLVAASVADEQALYCQRCHGILIKQGAFGEVVNYVRARLPEPTAAPKPLNRDDLKRELHCAVCGGMMDTHPYYGPGNIVIDVCMSCRLVWLDHGELSAIMNSPSWNTDSLDTLDPSQDN